MDHFRGLLARYTDLSFTPVLSVPKAGTGYRTGFVSEAVAEDLRDLDGWKAYMAGPPAMAEATMEVATRAGLRPRDLHAGVLFTPADEAVPSTPALHQRSHA